jgi:hypothetical protein
MDKMMNLNSLHLNYLTPLLKWRVLDLESLRKECVRAPKYHNFYRIIRDLEKKKVLEGYRDPYSRKKFVYLSSVGEGQLSLKDNPTALSKDTLIHDIKVSEISRELLDRGWIDEVELEHQIHDKRNFKINYKIIPDAIWYFERKGFKYQVAFELELTRKNNQRLVEKMKQYEGSGFYHYVIYIFPNPNLMNKYIEVIKEKLGSEIMGKVMFFCHEDMSSSVYDLDRMKGHFRDKSLSLREVFPHSN